MTMALQRSFVLCHLEADMPASIARLLAALCTVTIVACTASTSPPLTTTPADHALPTMTVAPSRVATRAVPTTIAPRLTETIAPTAVPVASFDLVLIGGTVIDGTGAEPIPNAVVAIRGERIVAVGRGDQIVIPPGTLMRDVRGMTILPGFINAHAHTHSLKMEQLKDWPRAGVTTVRDLQGPRDTILARRATIVASEDTTLPRLLVAGPMVTVPGGHPIPVYGLSDQILTVRDADDARAKINGLIDAGVDVIKIAVSGRTDVSWPELSNAEILAITETAHARGVLVTAHVDRAVALRRAVEQGINDAAHMPRDRMSNDLIALMVQRNVALVPTIAVYEALAEERGNGAAWRRTTLPTMQDNLRRFAAAGGTLALGDDYGNPGVALGMPMAEITHWLDAGLTPMDIIIAATHGGAVVCGLADQLGTIHPGMIADLLVVQGDPLTDITVLERVALVMKSGAVVAP
jgi:imidazolonepropionase-like amidohydrolase